MQAVFFKRVFGYQEKRTTVKIQIKKIGTFNKTMKGRPWPASAASFIF